MLNLLLSLPEANLLTFLFLLDHLKRLALTPGVFFSPTLSAVTFLFWTLKPFPLPPSATWF
jgi:hypothetical protein